MVARTGKRGPCDHCDTDRTSLWRNGPPGKTVLCNACGSWYRKKSTFQTYRMSNKALCKDKWTVKADFATNNDASYSIVPDDSSPNKPNDCKIPGDTKGNFWNFSIPKRKRSSVKNRRLSPIEKLGRDLLNILKSDPSIVTEEDLLIYNMNNFSISPKNLQQKRQLHSSLPSHV